MTTAPSHMWDIVADRLVALAKSLAAAGQEPRLLVPGLTNDSASAIHRRLLAEKIRSFLVCRPGESPSPPQGITVEGMTAVRKGEFVFVVPFSAIATLPESILGPGGVIRSPAYPTGWPWDDSGPPQLAFSTSVLPRLIRRWGVSEGDPQEEPLTKLVLATVADLKDSRRRRQVLMDEILGSFVPGARPVIDDFLRHCHVPCGPAVGDPGEFIKRARRLARNVLGRAEREPDLRAAVMANASQEFSELDGTGREQLEKLAAAFLDGLLGGSRGLSGLLALEGGLRCAEEEQAGASRVLDLETLERLFEVRTPVLAVLAIENLETDGGVVARSGHRVLSRYGSTVSFDARYSTGAADIDRIQVALTVGRGRQRLVEIDLDNSEGLVHIEIDTGEISTYQGTVNLSVQLRLDGDIVARTSIRAEQFGEQRPLVVCVGDKLTPATVGEDEDEVSADAPQHVFIGLEDASDSPTVIADERDREVRLRAGVWRTVDPVDPHQSPGGLVHVEVSSGCDNNSSRFLLQFETTERGRFTVYEEALSLIAKGLRDRSGGLLDRLTGRDSSFYPRLGAISPARLRLARLAMLFDDEPRGHLPVLTASAVEPSEIPDANRVGCSDIARWTESTARLPEVATAALDSSLVGAIGRYADIRREIIDRITARVEDVPANSRHPPYAYSPVYVETDAEATETLLVEYLLAFIDLLQLVRPSMPWGTRFLATSLDSAVSPDFASRKWGVRLLGPWHPVVLARRFLLEGALVKFARRHVLGRPELRVHGLAGLLDKLLPACWLPSLERVTRPAVLLPSTDAGWLIAVTLDDNLGRAARSQDCLALAATHVDRYLGLEIPGYGARSGDGITSTLRDFALVHSTARRIDLGFSDEFSLPDVASSLVDMFEKEEKERGSKFAGQLPGGVHAFVPAAGNEEVSEVADALRGSKITEEKLYLYLVEREDRPEVDVEFLGSTRRVSLAPAAPGIPAEIARSGGTAALLGVEPRDVIHAEVGWVGRTGCHEAQPESEDGSADLGRALTASAAVAQQLVADRSFQLSSPLELPSELRAPWIHTPGDEVDPALVRQFVCPSRDGTPRVLWDYRVTLGNSEAPAFFLFSKSPGAVTQAISSLLSPAVASGSDVLREMAEMGIALTGESERTGRRARGCVGLVGAARITKHLMGLGSSSAGIVVPVDAFASLVGGDAESPGSFTRRRTDLLLVRFWWSGEGESVTMSAIGVEAKYLSNSPSTGWVLDSLDQGAQTVTRLRWLVREAMDDAGLPIRAALATLFGFGLRLRSTPGDSVSQRAERIVQLALAAGRLAWSDPVRMGLTVVTGPATKTMSERRVARDKGLLVTLVPDDWPGEYESARLAEIRAEITRLFPSRPTGDDRGPGPAEEPPGDTPPALSPESNHLTGETPGGRGGEAADHGEGEPESDGAALTQQQPASDVATEPDSSPGGTQRRLSDDELEARYQILLGAFHELGLDVRDVQGEGRTRETPSSVKFRIKPTIRSLRQVTSARTVEALGYAQALQRDQILGLYPDLGEVVVDVPKREEERYFVLASDLWQRWEPRRRADRLELPLGIDHEGAIVSVDFGSCAHLLVAGQTGSGKSKALETLICGGAALFAPDQLRLVLVDGKRGVELGKFAALPHCHFPVGIDGPEGVERLERSVEELERRNDLLRASRTTNIVEFNAQAAPGDRLPWWLVVLDEYADLQVSGDSGPRLEQQLQRLGQLARAAGIHVVVSTQKPVVTVVTTVLKENLPARLAFRVTSAAGSRVILDEGGAERLNGKGDGILRDLQRSTRFQCAIVEPELLASLLDDEV